VEIDREMAIPDTNPVGVAVATSGVLAFGATPEEIHVSDQTAQPDRTPPSRERLGRAFPLARSAGGATRTRCGGAAGDRGWRRGGGGAR